ncbi:hypothetical protein QSH57_016417 [Fusarium oxysporum f. sp. vasinfectum]|nr:hypothetical protein QSH57_016417 [Fusarium oxysporum f. sp. vasinfectum]
MPVTPYTGPSGYTPFYLSIYDTYVLRFSMPGPTTSKAKAIAKSLLTSHGVLVGCTLLGKQWEKTDGGYVLKNEKPRGIMAGTVLRLYNKRGIFDNWHDDPNVFTRVLEDEFEHVETRVVSMMFTFRTAKPRRANA